MRESRLGKWSAVQMKRRGLNRQLQKMQEMRTPLERRFINCATCHRGHVHPLATR